MAEDTAFASAERDYEEHILNNFKMLAGNPTLKEITKALSQMLIILNKHRQIVYANSHFQSLLGVDKQEAYLGKRPGEILGCVHASQSSGGCGTTEFCSTCGAISAILEAQSGKKSVKECRIALENNEALELQVTASPFAMEGENFTIFVVNDISNEKRRQVLERVFFHDVLNSAGGISGLSTLISEINDPNELAEVAGMINRSANDLISEIQLQRELSEAERGDIALNITEIESVEVLKIIVDLYSGHEVSKGKELQLDDACSSFKVKTDAVLLKRILGNMTKNALEASLPNSKVTLLCRNEQEKLIFSVHNESHIPGEMQLQLFKRSFSTKGKGRGIGTYSMKLFGEKYLKGKVGFKSSEENGTVFFLELSK